MSTRTTTSLSKCPRPRISASRAPPCASTCSSEMPWTSITSSTATPTTRVPCAARMIEPSRMGGRAGSSRAPRSSTVTIVPRRLTNPWTNGGAPGKRVARRYGMISRTASMSQPYTFPATRNSSVRAVARDSGSVSEEAKVLQWIDIDERIIGARDGGERLHQLGRQRRPHLDRGPRDGMPEAEPCRMQEMPFRRQRNQTSAAPSPVGVVPHHRMSECREMYPDLMRATGVEMGAQQVHRIEAGEPHEVRSCRSSRIDDRHTLSVSRVACDRLVHRHAVGVEVAPAQRRVPPDDLPTAHRRAEHVVRAVALRHEQESGRLLVEPGHDALALG